MFVWRLAKPKVVAMLAIGCIGFYIHRDERKDMYSVTSIYEVVDTAAYFWWQAQERRCNSITCCPIRRPERQPYSNGISTEAKCHEPRALLSAPLGTY